MYPEGKRLFLLGVYFLLFALVFSVLWASMLEGSFALFLALEAFLGSLLELLALLAVSAALFSVTYRVRVSDTGLKGINLWGMPKKLDWGEIEKIEAFSLLGFHYVRFRAAKRFHEVVAWDYLGKWPDLARATRVKLADRPDAVRQFEAALFKLKIRAPQDSPTVYPRP
jgi:hypothetical protein